MGCSQSSNECSSTSPNKTRVQQPPPEPEAGAGLHSTSFLEAAAADAHAEEGDEPGSGIASNSFLAHNRRQSKRSLDIE
jgi:hypothetical protein